MKHLKRKLMMTLVALLALTTQAWATTVTWNSSDFNRDGAFTKDDVTVTTSNDARYYGNFYAYGVNTFTTTLGNFTKIEIVFKPESSPMSVSGWNYEVIEADQPEPQDMPDYWEYTSKLTWTGDAESVSIEAGVMGIQSITFTFADAAGATVPLTWDAATPNTATLTNGMPAGNVTVSVEYFPQAEFATSTDATLAPAAIANVPANTDAPIVTAGTVANIGTSVDKQGTLMYFVSQSTDNTVPDAPDYDTKGWSEDVPTANGLAEGKAFVWYYIKGAEPANIADRTDDNTRSDSDIMPLGTTGFVTLAAEPTYNVEFAEGTEESDKWKAEPATDVKKGQTVTVTYTGAKKVLGVKAEKKAKATEKTITIGEQNYTVLNGETWKQFITRNKLSNNWSVSSVTLNTWGVFMDEPYSELHVSSDGTNWKQLVFSTEDAPIDTDKQYKWVQEEIGSGGVSGGGVSGGEPLF